MPVRCLEVRTLCSAVRIVKESTRELEFVLQHSLGLQNKDRISLDQ